MIIYAVNGMVSVDTSCISRVSIKRVAPKYWYLNISYKNVSYTDCVEVISEQYAKDMIKLIDSRIEG